MENLSRLAFHEYLHVLGLDDANYRISGRFEDSDFATSYGECRDRLAQQYSNDSSRFHIADLQLPESINFESGVSSQNAVAIINFTLRSLGCSKSEIVENDSKSKVHCATLVPDVSSTTVCHVEMAFGFFYLMQDGADGINIIYNRWD